MSHSIIYKHAAIYEASMMGLYRTGYKSRYKAIADLIPDGTSVLELCCGPGILYRRYLAGKQIDYTGLDINPGFVKSLSRKGINARLFDVSSKDPLPKAGTVLMQASLYHFLPNPLPVIQRMLDAATRQVIIAEPITNIAQSRNALLAWTAATLTNAGQGKSSSRFNEGMLDDLFSAIEGASAYIVSPPGKREKIFAIHRNRLEFNPDRREK